MVENFSAEKKGDDAFLEDAVEGVFWIVKKRGGRELVVGGGDWRQRQPRMESWDLRAETGPQMSRGRQGLISQISQQGWEWNKRNTACC